MITISEIRRMSEEDILKIMRKIAANQVSASTVEETETQAMCFTVLCQRHGMDPKPKLEKAGYGILEKAIAEGWLQEVKKDV
jgi:hypothetical protein